MNEMRFQYLRELDNQLRTRTQPTLNVLGSFNGGGNSQGNILDHQDHYELQNYTSIIHGNHTMKFGARLRGIRDANSQTSGFNGEFTFSSLCSGRRQEASCVPAPGQRPARFPTRLQFKTWETRPTPIATQLTFTRGSPPLVVGNFDAGLYYQDDWKVRSNITFSYGLRFETQTGIQDHADWRRALALPGAWAAKAPRPKSFCVAVSEFFMNGSGRANSGSRASERHHAGTVCYRQSHSARLLPISRSCTGAVSARDADDLPD